MKNIASNKVLHLTLKKKWFDMILSGEKNEEYREIKPFWDKRLTEFIIEDDCPMQLFRQYDIIKFKNGYSKNAPEMTVEFKNIIVGFGNIWHGASSEKRVYIIGLGKILETKNIN